MNSIILINNSIIVQDVNLDSITEINKDSPSKKIQRIFDQRKKKKNNLKHQSLQLNLFQVISKEQQQAVSLAYSARKSKKVQEVETLKGEFELLEKKLKRQAQIKNFDIYHNIFIYSPQHYIFKIIIEILKRIIIYIQIKTYYVKRQKKRQ